MGTIFGYKSISIPEMPPCPCGDGNTMMCETTNNPLMVKFRCWCGRTIDCEFDSLEEMEEKMKVYSAEH